MTQNQQADLEGLKNISLLGFGSKVEHNAIHIMAVSRTPVRDRPMEVVPFEVYSCLN